MQSANCDSSWWKGELIGHMLWEAGGGREKWSHVGYIMKVEQTRYIRIECERKSKDDFMVSGRMGMMFIGEEDLGRSGLFEDGWAGLVVIVIRSSVLEQVEFGMLSYDPRSCFQVSSLESTGLEI